MNDTEIENRCLKKLVKAQHRMLTGYRTGKPDMPEWVFKAIEDAKNVFDVRCVSKIK